MLDQGYLMEIASPKGVFALAYQEGILSDEALWLDMLESRNLTSHDYGRKTAEVIAEKISNRYAKALTELSKYISSALK